jgi:hypothetical protein
MLSLQPKLRESRLTQLDQSEPITLRDLHAAIQDLADTNGLVFNSARNCSSGPGMSQSLNRVGSRSLPAKKHFHFSWNKSALFLVEMTGSHFVAFSGCYRRGYQQICA